MEKELTSNDKIKEKIKFNTEVLRLSAIGILTIGSGLASLIDQAVFSGRRNFMVALGLILIGTLLTFLLTAVKAIYKTIK